jgi:hypothetical protein
MSDETAARVLTIEELLLKLAELREIYGKVGPRSIFDHRTSDTALQLMKDIQSGLGDQDLNQRLQKEILAHSGGPGFRARHHVMLAHPPRDGMWKHEARLLTLYGIDENELKQLRIKAQKFFARRTKNQKHPSQVTAVALHPLSGVYTIKQLASELATQKFVEIGKDNRAILRRGDSTVPRLTRKQKMERRRMAARDRRILAGCIILLVNYQENIGAVFRLSYTLAVGEACLRR